MGLEQREEIKKMKKILIVLSLVLIVGLGSAFAYADTPIANRFQSPNNFNNTTQEEWFKERMELRKEYLKDAVKEGLITEEEAKTWEEHYNYMDEFHLENGFRGCFGGRGMGMMRGFGRNNGFRRAPMGW